MIIRRASRFIGLPLTFSLNKMKRSFCVIEKSSEETLKRFKECLQQNSEESLEQGAQLLATLEFQVEQNDEIITELQAELDLCSGEVLEVIKKIQKIQQNIELQKEQIDSIQSRTQKQISDCRNYSISKIAKQILDVADSLNRAYQHSLKVHSSEDHEVVVSITKAKGEMKNIFQKYGIEQFDPVGQQYDANTQEALASIENSQGKLKRTVAHTMRTGYKIKGRLLRSAHVAIYS